MIETEGNNIWVPLSKREKLSMSRICAVASGNLVPGLLWNVISALFEPFNKSLGISITIKTILLFYASFIGFVLQPILGVISDRLTFKYGRRRIFVITGSILVVIALLLMMYCYEIGTFLKPSHPQPYRKIIFITSHVIASTAGNIVQSPARVLCSDVTPLAQQSLMSNICQVYFGLSSIIPNLLGGFEIYKYTGLKQEQFLLVVSLSLAFIAMIISVISAVEEPLLVKPPKVNPFKKIWQAFKSMPRPFIRIAAPYCLSFVAIYQYGLAFTDFMGAEIMNGNNQEDASDEMKKLYQKGVSWAMMCNSINSLSILIYGFLNNKVCELIGMKWTMVIGDFLISLSLIFFLVVKNKYVYLGLAGLIGLGTVAFMAIPPAIVSIVIPTEELGNNLGILNCFCVIGQQLSNFIIGSGVGRIVHNSSGKKIGYSAVFGFLATITSFWVVQPSLAEAGQYQSIKDNPTDFTYVSEINN